MGRLITFAFVLAVIWIIRRDTKRRDGISGAIWIPTLWVGILASRPLSTWLDVNGGSDSLEGSPADRLFFLAMIFAALFTLSRRRINWGVLIARNWPILLFYGFFLVSTLWAYSPIVAWKRWFKDLGNVFVALVILTEINPQQAFRAVFVRCAYVLIPLSVIFIRYFPALGRRYSAHTGAMEATGVTFQKNSLGALVMVCGVILIWDWLERSRPENPRQSWLERLLPPIVLIMGASLLHTCGSKTSMVCLAVGAVILAAPRLPFLRNRMSAIGIYAQIGALVFVAIDRIFGISKAIVLAIGGDMTFTGRTEVWENLLDLDTNSLIGVGFCSFWSDPRYVPKLPDWMGFSAHCGYVETYIDGGFVGVAFLAVMLIAIAIRFNVSLRRGNNYALVQFAVLLVVLVGNFSESHFGRMSPVWFLFLVAAIDYPPRVSAPASGLPEAYDTMYAEPIEPEALPTEPVSRLA